MWRIIHYDRIFQRFEIYKCQICMTAEPEEGIPSKILSIGRQREKSFQSSERQQALQSNAEYVDSHNKNASKSYKLELNKFAAWTQVNNSLLNRTTSAKPCESKPGYLILKIGLLHLYMSSLLSIYL